MDAFLGEVPVVAGGFLVDVEGGLPAAPGYMHEVIVSFDSPMALVATAQDNVVSIDVVIAKSSALEGVVIDGWVADGGTEVAAGGVDLAAVKPGTYDCPFTTKA